MLAFAQLGTAFTLAFTVLLFFVSIPAHGGLVAACAVRCVRRGAGKMRWAWVYLLTAAIVHVAVAARRDAFESIEHKIADWQRKREQPAQSAFERAFVHPFDVAAVRAALSAGANPDAVTPRNPLFPLVLGARRGHLDVRRCSTGWRRRAQSTLARRVRRSRHQHGPNPRHSMPPQPAKAHSGSQP
jgi:hypothetical protein